MLPAFVRALHGQNTGDVIGYIFLAMADFDNVEALLALNSVQFALSMDTDLLLT